nr:WG repeat-containing protein [uncultured Sphingobacterium sp.]
MTFFKDNVAIVTNKKGKYGAIDLNGVEIMPLKYDYLSYDKLNQYLFIENGKYGLIVVDSIVIQPKYDMLTFLIDEFARQFIWQNKAF